MPLSRRGTVVVVAAAVWSLVSWDGVVFRILWV